MIFSFPLISNNHGQCSKYSEATRWMLEDILTVQSTGIFDETRWNCDGSLWNSEGCSALRNAIFCLSNYYFIQRLSVQVRNWASTWQKEDKDDLSQFFALCSPLVPISQVGAVADCEEAMRHLGLEFPSPQCMQFKRLLRHYSSQGAHPWPSRTVPFWICTVLFLLLIRV